MTWLALVAHPPFSVDHLEYASLIGISCRYGESVQISGWGVGWGSLSHLECNRAFPVKNKGNKSYKELTEAILTKNISIFRNGGWHHLPGRVKHEASDTSRRSWEVFALVQWYTPDMTHFYLCGRSYTFCQTRHSSCSISLGNHLGPNKIKD